jgi:AcrR family transcriptional regulator
MLDLDHGRVNQKRRTRAALVAAAIQLLRQGRVPSVAEVADAAQVGRSTAYSYFPTQEALLTQAAVDLADEDWLSHFRERIGGSREPAVRLDAAIRAHNATVSGNEAAHRAMLRASLEPRAEDPEAVPRRPGYRLTLLAEALQPVQEKLGEEQFAQLIAALALCSGIEATVVLRDVCALDSREAEGVMRWAAQALLRAGLAEADWVPS